MWQTTIGNNVKQPLMRVVISNNPRARMTSNEPQIVGKLNWMVHFWVYHIIHMGIELKHQTL